MAENQTSGSVRRFGSRYGRKIKDKLANIESLQKKKYQCPYCNKEKVKRKSVGIWECRSCGSVMTGKAYSLSKPADSKKGSVQEEHIDVDKMLEPEQEEDYNAEENSDEETKAFSEQPEASEEDIKGSGE